MKRYIISLIYSAEMVRLISNIKFILHRMNVNGGGLVQVIRYKYLIRIVVKLRFKFAMISNFQSLHELQQIWVQILFSLHFVQKIVKATYVFAIVHKHVRLKIKFIQLFPVQLETYRKRKIWIFNMLNLLFLHLLILNLPVMEL